MKVLKKVMALVFGLVLAMGFAACGSDDGGGGGGAFNNGTYRLIVTEGEEERDQGLNIITQSGNHLFIIEQCGQELAAYMLAIIKCMFDDHPFTRVPAPHLVKEEVAKPVNDHLIIGEFHCLRNMTLHAGDDIRPGPDQRVEIITLFVERAHVI